MNYDAITKKKALFLNFDKLFPYFLQFNDDFFGDESLLNFKMQTFDLLGNKNYAIRMLKEMENEKKIILALLDRLKQSNFTINDEFQKSEGAELITHLFKIEKKIEIAFDILKY